MINGLEQTLDHTGPMAMMVADVALLLEVVAGRDPLDPRQRNVVTMAYTEALGMIQNTCPFDCTSHPAMNVPCAMSDGLPVGMMLIGRRFEEDMVLRCAHAFEQTGTYVPGSRG